MFNQKRPNFVLIHADQFRADCLSLHGHPELCTPNLDQLALEGADFLQAYSSAPVCSPARRSLLTGCSPAYHGCFDNSAVRIRHPEATLPELLKKAGYQTADIGRGMHQYPDKARYGFEVIERSPYESHDSRVHDEIRPASRSGQFSNWPHLLNHGLPLDGYAARPWPYSEDFHHTTWTVNKAIEYLDRRDDEQPFFLSVGFVAPHPPLTPPAFYYERYHDMDLAPPVVGDWAERPANNAIGMGSGSSYIPLGRGEIMHAQAAYYGLINHIDDMLHNLLWRINMCNQPTYILFCSDHGEQLGDHHFFRKSKPYQGSVHIPFTLKGPGIRKQTQIRSVVMLEDILPTFCELAGLEIPSHVEGQSLVALLNGREEIGRDYACGEQGDSVQKPYQYLTDGKWKYIWFSTVGQEQLFHLEKDPKELTDLASIKEHQAVLKRFRAVLVEKLRNRKEGFVQGDDLVAVSSHPSVLEHALRI